MTVPSRVAAAALLVSLDPPPWALAHACAVAEVAAWLARRIEERGIAVDRAAVEAAALLHDVDKLRSARVEGTRHGEGSAAWLTAHGLAELGPLVRDHPVTRLADDVDAARLAAAPLEARIVAYADKRAGQRLESMDERFGSWRRRYPSGPADPRDSPSAPGAPDPARRGSHTPTAPDGPPRGHGWDDEVSRRVEARALALEREVCAAAGIDPAGVRRLRWSRRALREAVR
jgi:putative nucleotidyltransferase with HDIG domain